jgi:hypothetical protein
MKIKPIRAKKTFATFAGEMTTHKTIVKKTGTDCKAAPASF